MLLSLSALYAIELSAFSITAVNDVGEYSCGSNLLCSLLLFVPLLLFVQINFRLFNAKCDQSTISFQLSMTAFHRQTVISLFPFIRAARQDGRVCSLLLFVQFNFRQFNAN